MRNSQFYVSGKRPILTIRQWTPHSSPVRVNSGTVHCDVIMRPMASQSPASRLFALPFVQVQIKETSKLRVTGPCDGNPPVASGLPSQRASNAENVSISWRHHAKSGFRSAHGTAVYNTVPFYRDPFYNRTWPCLYNLCSKTEPSEDFNPTHRPYLVSCILGYFLYPQNWQKYSEQPKIVNMNIPVYSTTSFRSCGDLLAIANNHLLVHYLMEINCIL